MDPQSCKVVNTHAREISGWKIQSSILYARAPIILGMTGDVQSDLSTLAFNNRGQLEDFHSIIIMFQQ